MDLFGDNLIIGKARVKIGDCYRLKIFRNRLRVARVIGVVYHQGVVRVLDHYGTHFRPAGVV